MLWSFRKDRREGRAVHLTNPRRQAGTVGINGEHFLLRQEAVLREPEQPTVSVKWCRGLLLAAIVVDQCRGQESGTSGFMGGFVADSRMLVCMHLSMWEAPLNPPAKREDRR